MNRTDLVTLLLSASLSMLISFQSVRAEHPNQELGLRTIATQATISGNTLRATLSENALQIAVSEHILQIVGASHRITHFSKIIVLESLIITKKTINFTLDAAIKSL